jgi:hypothetical protein
MRVTNVRRKIKNVYEAAKRAESRVSHTRPGTFKLRAHVAHAGGYESPAVFFLLLRPQSPVGRLFGRRLPDVELRVAGWWAIRHGFGLYRLALRDRPRHRDEEYADIPA